MVNMTMISVEIEKIVILTYIDTRVTVLSYKFPESKISVVRNIHPNFLSLSIKQNKFMKILINDIQGGILEIRQEKSAGKVIIHLSGRLDSNTSSQLEKVTLSLIESGEKLLIIDFQELEYLSSAGLRVLLITLKKITKQKGELIICNLREFIYEVFKISGFTSIFNIAESLEAALK